jgi:hypothetical protein
MFLLGSQLGWTRSRYENNRELQVQFLEDLYIPTYNGFRDFLFWDIALSLSKVYIIKEKLKSISDGISEESLIEGDEDIYRSDQTDDDRQHLNDQSEKVNGLDKTTDLQTPEVKEGSRANSDQIYFNKARQQQKLKLRLELEFEVI